MGFELIAGHVGALIWELCRGRAWTEGGQEGGQAAARQGVSVQLDSVMLAGLVRQLSMCGRHEGVHSALALSASRLHSRRSSGCGWRGG